MSDLSTVTSMKLKMTYEQEEGHVGSFKPYKSSLSEVFSYPHADVLIFKEKR